MPIVIFPPIQREICLESDDSIIHYFRDSGSGSECVLLSRDPFVIKHGDDEILITTEQNQATEAYDRVLFAGKKPTARDLENGALKLKRWIKHPDIIELRPEDVISSWTNQFSFIKEDLANGIPGLRPPQLGALHSILGHIENADDVGIVVMPTGTGKTETMLCATVANKCTKLLVTVPSDALREQISEKFLKLGLLKQFGIVGEGAHAPIVGILRSKVIDIVHFTEFIEKVNVVVTTMAIAASAREEVRSLMAERFTHLFIDEAHHTGAATWQRFVNGFRKDKVFLFTATPYRNDGKKLSGKFIFNFPLRKAQEL